MADSPREAESPREIVEWLRLARDGDVAARDQLFEYLGDDERFSRVLLAMARRLFPPHHRARDLVESHDLVQSALYTGMAHLEEFRGESEAELFGWLRSILRSKVSRAARRSKLASERMDRHAVSESSDDEFPARLVSAELRDTLQSAVAALPPEQRLVIELRLRGANSTEIGRILGLKPATVRKRESRAVERLREWFA